MATSRSFLYITMLLFVATLDFSAKAQTPQQSLLSLRTPPRLTNTNPTAVYGHEIIYDSPSTNSQSHQHLRSGNYYPTRGPAGLHTIPAGALYNSGGLRGNSAGPGYGSAGLPFSAAGPPASFYNPDIDSSGKSPVPATATAPATFRPSQAFAQETLEEGPYYNTGLRSGPITNYPRDSLELAGRAAYSGPDARNSFYPYSGTSAAGVPTQPSRNPLYLAGRQSAGNFASDAGFNRFSGVVPTDLGNSPDLGTTQQGNSFYARPGRPSALLFTPNTVQQPAETAGQLGEYRKALEEEQRQRLHLAEDGDTDDEQTQDDFSFSSVGGPYYSGGDSGGEDSFSSLKNNAENGNAPKSYVNVEVNGDKAYNFGYRI